MAGTLREWRIARIDMRNNANLLVGGECLEGQPKGDGLRAVVVHLKVRGATVHNVVDGGQSRHVVFVAFARISLPDLTHIVGEVFCHFAFFLDGWWWMVFSSFPKVIVLFVFVLYECWYGKHIS